MTTYTGGETPTLAALFELAMDRWERQAQTAFPAKVTEFDDTEQTVTVEPAFYETFRAGTERASHAINPIPNVPILYPRGNGFSIYIPPAVGDWVLVVCAKYSLDRWRETATSGDPGDLRRFTLDGAIAIPGVYPNDPITDGVGNTTDMVITVPASKKLRIGSAAAAESAVMGQLLRTALLNFANEVQTAMGEITASGINHTTSQATMTAAVISYLSDITQALSVKTWLE